ncbi:preprotein translocase subunit SecG [Nannocystaceae bacterium ST9]
MVTFVTIVFIFVSLVMVLAILLQAGKGGGMGTALGGTASQGVFGGGGQADFMAKMTQGFAATFMISAMYLAYASAHAGSEFLESEDQGGSTMLDEDEDFDPEMVGYRPLQLPTEEEAKLRQAAASVSVPAQTPTDGEPAIEPPAIEPPAIAPPADSPQGDDSAISETPPSEPTREAPPSPTPAAENEP